MGLAGLRAKIIMCSRLTSVLSGPGSVFSVLQNVGKYHWRRLFIGLIGPGLILTVTEDFENTITCYVGYPVMTQDFFLGFAFNRKNIVCSKTIYCSNFSTENNL